MNEHEGHGHEDHIEAVEGHADESIWDIMTDPPHLVAELAFEGTFLILSTLVLKWKLRKRDCEHGHTEIHNHYTESEQDLVKNLTR